MSPSNDDTRSAAGKPTLEALLRLKRAERPDAAFWDEFDRGLRQKQLAAIIEPKPWWLGLELIGRRLAPFGLPVSAGAAALLAVMAVRTQSPVSDGSDPVRFGPSAVVARPAMAAIVPNLSDAMGTGSPVLASVDVSASTPNLPEREHVEVSKPPAEALAASAPEGPFIPSLLEIAPATHAAAPTPSELIISQNLEAAAIDEPSLVASATRIGSPDAGTEGVELSEGEPALKMEVRNPRHARVLLAMADSPAIEASGGITNLRERMVRSIVSDDALGSSASRLGVGGDRLSVSF